MYDYRLVLFQDKDIYLLDDPLSAVDVHVARHLFSHCISGVLKYKTRLLCTHQIQFMEQADYIILMDNGQILRAGLLFLLQLKSCLIDN